MINSVTSKAAGMVDPVHLDFANSTNVTTNVTSTSDPVDPLFDKKFELAMAVTFAVGTLQVC